eukprot:1177468-Prorocentrum_minimum.AAC.1
MLLDPAAWPLPAPPETLLTPYRPPARSKHCEIEEEEAPRSGGGARGRHRHAAPPTKKSEFRENQGEFRETQGEFRIEFVGGITGGLRRA